MEPPFRFDAHYDESLVRRAAWCFARRRFGSDRRLWAALAAGEVFALAWAWRFDDAWMIGFAFGLPALAGCLFIAVWRSHRAAALRKMRALDAARATFTIAEDGLTVASRAVSTTITWAALEDVWIYPDFWIVTLAVNSYFTMPIASAAPQALVYLQDRLGARVSPSNMVGPST